MEVALLNAAEEKSAIIKSFWLGKFLQQVPEVVIATHSHSTQEEQQDAEEDSTTDGEHVCGRPLHAHIEEALLCLKQCGTSLSPNVFDLIVNAISDPLPAELELSPQHGDHLSKDGTMNWDYTSKCFGPESMLETDFSLLARRCAVIAKQLYFEIMKNDEICLCLETKQDFEWTHSPQVFADCVAELKSEYSLRVNLCLLIGTAALERSLGDVYLTISQAGQCPSLLKDLLITPELEKTFGSTAMTLLRCLIGPPTSLNLRNVLWHGFASHTEIPIEFAHLFFVVVSSLGERLMVTSPRLVINHRPCVVFPQEPVLAGVFAELRDDEIPAIESLFSESFFILPSMLPTWRAAIEAFKTKRYGHFAVLILPSLEHALRRVFACVNGCPERTLTAESSVLYTTFDEILSPALPNGEENKLVNEIGVAKMEMLLDLLVHPEGPRLRDRVSHGEVDFQSISRTISNHLLCLVTLFCAQYSLSKSTIEREPVVRCLLVEHSYVSLFHPISLFRRELENMVCELDKWKDIPTPPGWNDKSDDDSSSAASCSTSSKLHLREKISTSIGQISQHIPLREQQDTPSHHPLAMFISTQTVEKAELMEMVAGVWEMPLETLFVAKHTLELTGLMRRTVDNLHKAVRQVSETAMLRYSQSVQKQLRSRQRNNYHYLLESLQLYQSAVVLVVVMLVAMVSHFTNQTRSIKFMKKVLQFSENFYSQSSPSKNRWEEVDKLCSNLTELAEQIPT